MREYIKETHEYREDGIILPNLTKILDEFFPFYDNGNSQYYKDRGTAIHETIRMYEEKTLDVDNLAEGNKKCLLQWIYAKEFLGITEIYSCEKPLFSKQGYGCTPDIVSNIGIVELKLGSKSKRYQIQTAAQLQAWNENNKDKKIKNRFVVYFNLNGDKPKIDSHATKTDLSVFLSCLQIYKFKEL